MNAISFAAAHVSGKAPLFASARDWLQRAVQFPDQKAEAAAQALGYIYQAMGLPKAHERMHQLQKDAKQAVSLLREPAFVAAIAAASLVQASHAVYYGFATIDWQGASYDGSVIGALWALGVVAEIALFALERYG